MIVRPEGMRRHPLTAEDIRTVVAAAIKIGSGFKNAASRVIKISVSGSVFAATQIIRATETLTLLLIRSTR